MIDPYETALVIQALTIYALTVDDEETDIDDATTLRRIAHGLTQGDLIITEDPTPVALPILLARLEAIPDPWSTR